MNLQKKNRIENEKYLEWVRTLPSVLSGIPAEPHHLIGHGHGGMGMKASDIFAFPLSRMEHTELHDIGWREWEDRYGDQRRFVMLTLEQAFREGIIK